MNIHIFDYVTFSITLGMGCNAFMYHTGVNTEFNSAKFRIQPKRIGRRSFLSLKVRHKINFCNVFRGKRNSASHL